MRSGFVIAAAVVSMTTFAHAELPTIDSEHPPTIAIGALDYGLRVERVELDIHSAPAISWLAITVAGRERTVALPIDVPVGTHLIGMSLTSARGSAWSKPMPARRTRADRHADAVLAWHGRSADQDHVVLQVDVPATFDRSGRIHAEVTIQIGLQLPALTRLAIDTQASRASFASVEIDGGGRKTWRAAHGPEVVDLSRVATAGTELPAVDRDTSLVAAVVDPSAFLESPPPHQFFTRSLDKAIIRRRMKQHRPQLQRCYEQVVQFDQWHPPQGGAVVTFWIGGDGAVHDASIDSDLPDRVKACLVTEVLRWEFPESDDNIQVNYPIEFRLAGR